MNLKPLISPWWRVLLWPAWIWVLYLGNPDAISTLLKFCWSLGSAIGVALGVLVLAAITSKVVAEVFLNHD